LAAIKAKWGFETLDCSEVLKKAAEHDHQIKADLASGNLVSSELVVKKLI
jgi:hypothetical protein